MWQLRYIVLSFDGQREKQYSLVCGARKPLSPGTSREELGLVGLFGSISFWRGQFPGMVLGPVCSVLAEDKMKSFCLDYRNW